MTKIKYSVIVIAILLIGNACSSGSKTPEDLGREMLNCIKENDYDSFKDLFVTNKELELMKVKYKNNRQNKFNYSYNSSDREKSIRKLFEKIRKKGVSKKIEWANVKEFGSDAKFNEQTKDEAYNVYIDVKHFDKKYFLLLDRCIYTKNGWKSMFGFSDVQFYDIKYRKY